MSGPSPGAAPVAAAGPGLTRAGGNGIAPAARAASYYGHPVLQAPVWEDLIGWYLFAGGLGGASLTLAAGARLRGNDVLARRALLGAVAGLGVSPPLLIADLGRPARFHHMLRVFKPSSPMSVGTWVLTGAGLCTGVAIGCEVLGVLRPLGRAAELGGGILGTAVATYTGVLVADTAVPAWHGARHELPALFAASAAASAGGAATLLTPTARAGPARRLAAGAVAVESVVTAVLERRLGSAGTAYRTGRAARLLGAARLFGLGGGGLALVAGRRSRPLAAAGGLAVLAGSACLRLAVLDAGRASAADPRATVEPQRERLAARAR